MSENSFLLTVNINYIVCEYCMYHYYSRINQVYNVFFYDKRMVSAILGLKHMDITKVNFYAMLK